MSYHTPPTDEELTEMQARCDAATPGPWNSFNRLIVDEYLCYKSDGKFIDHARTDLPRLIAEVNRLKAEVERLKADLSNAQWEHAEGW